VKTLRYRTWRRSLALGALLIAGCFAGGIVFRDERWVLVFKILGGAVAVVSVAFHAAVALLRKSGMLEFSYSEEDKFSYLYHQESLYRQMKEQRRTKGE
jgi:hypothetical protein